MPHKKAQVSDDAEMNSLVVNNKVLRLILKVCAILCVVLGVVGAFLPLLPTTPFLLLAVFFSLRSSPAIHRWLIHHPKFGPPLERYFRERSISVELYWRATLIMWLSMLFAIWLVKPLALKVMLAVIAVSVTIYMTRLMKRGKLNHAVCEHKDNP